MARMAIINYGVVANIILADQEWPGGVECPDGVLIGWSYSKGEFTAPAVPDPAPPSTDPHDYPLTALEFDAALVRLGIDRDAVAPAIRSIMASDLDAMADSLARWWNLKSMTRDNAVMAMLKPVFDVTDAEIDAAWMATVDRRN